MPLAGQVFLCPWILEVPVTQGVGADVAFHFFSICDPLLWERRKQIHIFSVPVLTRRVNKLLVVFLLIFLVFGSNMT